MFSFGSSWRPQSPFSFVELASGGSFDGDLAMVVNTPLFFSELPDAGLAFFVFGRDTHRG